MLMKFLTDSIAEYILSSDVFRLTLERSASEALLSSIKEINKVRTDESLIIVVPEGTSDHDASVLMSNLERVGVKDVMIIQSNKLNLIKLE